MSRSAFGGVADLWLVATHQELGNLSRIQVHKSLLDVALLDQLPERNSEKPPIVSSAEVPPDRRMRGSPRPAERANVISAR